jgi:hypothetical protein
MFNFKNKKLRFVSLIPELTKTMPIIEANKINFSWYKTAINDFKSLKAQESITAKTHHISRCPGINSIVKYGWIQRTYQDIVIKTNGDGQSFDWSTPIDQSSLVKNHEWNYDYVSYHDASIISPYKVLKPSTLKTIIKIQSPWIAYIPDGYSLLHIPIPYGDDTRFTSASGILESGQGPNFLNVQLFWHKLNSEEIIPAGTPIMQYLLIKNENIDAAITEFTDIDLENLRLRRMLLDSNFLTSYSKLKNFFKGFKQ